MPAKIPLPRNATITPSQLRAEGVIHIGSVLSIAFVVTERGWHLFHAEALFAREQRASV